MVDKMSEMRIKEPATVENIIYLIIFASVVSAVVWFVFLPLGDIGVAVK